MILPQPRLLILLKASRGLHLVDVRSILYAQAEERFCRMHFTDGTDAPVFHTLAELETILRCGERMGDLLFVRAQKSYLAAFHHATAIDRSGGLVLGDRHRVPIGREYWRAILNTAMSVHPKP